jgi:hypothetical protein
MIIPVPFSPNEVFAINGKKFLVLDYWRPVSWSQWSAWYLIQDEGGRNYEVPYFHILIQKERGNAKYVGTRV